MWEAGGAVLQEGRTAPRLQPFGSTQDPAAVKAPQMGLALPVPWRRAQPLGSIQPPCFSSCRAGPRPPCPCACPAPLAETAIRSPRELSSQFQRPAQAGSGRCVSGAGQRERGRRGNAPARTLLELRCTMSILSPARGAFLGPPWSRRQRATSQRSMCRVWQIAGTPHPLFWDEISHVDLPKLPGSSTFRAKQIGVIAFGHY